MTTVARRNRSAGRAHSWLWAAAVLLVTIGGASAQTFIIDRRDKDDEAHSNEIQVQVTVDLMIASSARDGEGALLAQERARRALYQVAAQECALLRSVIANDCRLQSLNLNINPQYGQQGTEMLATGNFGLRISLK